MAITKIRLQDFRVVADACLELDPDETIIIGENNTGKSAVLQALDIAIGRAEPVIDDLHVAEDGGGVPEAVIDLLIGPRPPAVDFDLDVADLFGQAVLQPAGNPPRPRIGLRCKISVAGEGERVTWSHRFLTDWADDRATAETIPTIPGPQGTFNQAQRRSIAYFLLDASRDLVSELRSRRTVIGRVLSDLGIDASEVKALSKRLSELGEDIATKSTTLANVRVSLEALTQALGGRTENIEVHSIPPDVRMIGQSVDVRVKAQGSASLPLSAQGSGSRSLTSLLVFRSLVELRVASDATVDSPLSVLGIEEPEAHLHPQAQAAAYRAVAELPGQRIIATHSYAPVRAAPPRRLRRLARSGAGVVASSLRDCGDQVPELFRRFVLRTRPDTIFARVVVLVEGETEEPAVAAYLRQNWGAGDAEGAGVSVVDAGGVDNVPKISEAFDALGVRWIALVDDDTQGNGARQTIQDRVGRDPLADPQIVFRTGASDLEAHFAANHRDLVESWYVRGAQGPQHAAALQTAVQAMTEEQVAEKLRTGKGTWGRDVVTALGPGESIGLFDALLARVSDMAEGAP